MTLTVRGLRVAYRPGRPVVDDVDLVVPTGTFTGLLGPSGCGKTTLLKTVAGLLEPDGGELLIAGTSVRGVPAERRPVGLVFQKPLLFPHLTIGDNVAFGLRMRGVPRPARRRRVAEALELVGLPELAGRRVGELSGGQEQRVALARALVLDPQVLLLDEPFSQLDADLRVRVRELVRGVQRELGITTLFVTHDQQEAVDLADGIALMLDGRIEAHGRPEDFYARPATLRAARFFGATNEFPGEVRGGAFEGALGRLVVEDPGPDRPGVLVVRPESVRLVPCGDALDARPANVLPANVLPANVLPANVLPGTVRETRFRGSHRSATVAVPGGLLTLTVAPGVPLVAGDTVHVQLPPAACRVLPPLGPAAQAPVPSSARSDDHGTPAVR